jgi:two-component system KDP operon response regulator KdpE
MGLSVLVLVADDILRGVLAIALRADGHRVQLAANDDIARERLAAGQPDLLLLDCFTPLPEPPERWAAHAAGGVPLLLLVPAGDEAQRLAQPNTVTLPMPFGRAALREAVAEIASVERVGSEAQLVVDDLVLDPSGSVWRAGVPVELGPTERRVLTALVARPDAPVPTQALIRAAWGTATPSSTAYLALYIRILRQKLEADPDSPRHLRAVRGGYAFSTAPTTRR